MSESNKIYGYFWQLLRAGLWNDSRWLKCFGILEEKQWIEIVKISKRTGTTALIGDGISLLKEEELPSQKVVTRLIKSTLSNKKIHIKHNLVIRELFEFFNKHNIEAILLKGQGAAAAYLNPERRNCGDIDIYIGLEQFDHVLEELEKIGYTRTEEINDTGKHASLFYDDVVIELHRYSTHIDNSKADEVYQKWWLKEMTDNDSVIYLNASGDITNDKDPQAFKIDIPSPTVNAFYLFYHIFHHYIGKEVQFRQFCDLARHLWLNKDVIKQDTLLTKIEEMHLVNVWQIFGDFLFKYIGLPKEAIPGYVEINEKKLNQFVERLYNKCFLPTVEKKERPQNRLMGKLFSFKQHFNAALEVMNIFPKESLEYVVSTIKSGTILLFSKSNRSDTLEHYTNRKKSENNDN